MLRAGTRQEAEGTERRRLSCPAPGRAAWVKGDEAWTPRLCPRLGPGWRPSPLSLRCAGPRAVSVLGGSPAAARSGAWQPQEACARAPSCAMGRRPPGIPLLGKAALTLGLVLLYYCFSIGITFYNKWLMKSFHFPLFMTLLHLLVIFLLSALTRALMHCCTKRSRVVLTWDDYLRRVAPTALSTALDIGLSNWSFLYITVSLYTMTKSSAILFILLFSLIFKLEELGFRIPLTPCSTCSLLCSWGSSLSLLCLREICTLLLATHLLGDHLNLLNWVGFAVCLSGISLHVTLKAFSSKGEKESKLHKGTSSSPDLELLLRRSEAEEEEEEVVTELQH
ncbi:solute carrier family 35 member C2 isoform X5 [Chrysemys picta bellii]|uniref:solute carrier family 35 member C2 isoform X5 n=1 Tax=Chrysemys picta bellii TaxID=8478 RepID=UPI0032B101D6